MRASFKGAMERTLGVPFGMAARNPTGSLVIGSGPGEWLVLGLVGEGRGLLLRLEEMAKAAGEQLVTILDITHGRALCG